MTETTRGLSTPRLQHLQSVIEADVAAGRYRGIAAAVSRHGEVGLTATAGQVSGADPTPITADTVFSLFSMTKAFTSVLTLRAIERGELALTTRVVEVIPAFTGQPREQITVLDLLTHRSGLPSVFTPRPGMNLDKLDEIIDALCRYVHATERPGVSVAYSPMAGHALLGEMVRRTDAQGRGYRQIVEDELFTPLGMTSSAIGVRADLKARHAVPEFQPDFPATHPGSSNLGPNGAFEEEHAEMPWVGAVSTVGDVWRFCEMLRRGGELDGARILGPRILDVATTNQTGDAPNELFKNIGLARGWRPMPAYIGLGLVLRGERLGHSQFGTLTTPRTFGGFGAGTTVFWVDPELGMTFVGLSTGMMNEPDNTLRYQRLSDIAVSAAV